jgi:hypothetical protein
MISDLFHTTTADDDTIAYTLAAQGRAVSIQQVQQARLTNSWPRGGGIDSLNSKNNDKQQQLLSLVSREIQGRTTGDNTLRQLYDSKGIEPVITMLPPRAVSPG